MTAQTTPCPHCKRPLTVWALANHHWRCVYRPGISELVKRLAESDIPGVAGNSEHYKWATMEYNRSLESPSAMRAPALQTLRDYVGDWETITHWCGLRTMEEHNLARLAAEGREVVAILEAERNRGGAFTVYREREIDGGRRVALEIR